MLKQRALLLLLTLLLLVLSGWWTVYISQQREGQRAYSIEQRVLPSQYVHGLIPLTHNYAKGMHSYAGELMLPACDSLGASVATQGNGPIKVIIALKVVEPSTPCSDTSSTKMPFSVGLSGDKDATTTVRLTINGAPAPFTLLEAK